ncbi:MAG: hypothetical protein ABL986_03065 [Vicinamibacterales bacterium]
MTTETVDLRRHSFLKRLVGAAALNAGTYEEVEADRGALTQAGIVVLLSSVAAGLGARGFGASRPVDVAFFAFVALVGWVAWAGLTYQIGVRFLSTAQTHADLGQLLRTIGFASAPGIFRIVGVVPSLTGPVFFISAVWMLIAMIVAVRHALDYEHTGRAVAVCTMGWVLAGIIALALGALFGPQVT